MAEKDFDVNRFYDSLAGSWDGTRPGYTEKIFEKITYRLDKNKSYYILDFGCGTGLLCRFVSERFPNARIDGIDVSSRMIETARANCPNRTFYAGDIFRLDLPAYDVIISKDVFNHIEDVPTTISRLDCLLKARGQIIVANRGRERGTKDSIMSSLEALGYGLSVEVFSFAPTKEEIDTFLQAIPDFSGEHKAIIRKQLESAGDYYIIFAEKTGL